MFHKDNDFFLNRKHLYKKANSRKCVINGGFALKSLGAGPYCTVEIFQSLLHGMLPTASVRSNCPESHIVRVGGICCRSRLILKHIFFKPLLMGLF